jgi:ribosome maturation factor RimP
LSANLDVEDFIPVAYTLEVSSPGLDRPLVRPDDYRRFTGRRAKVVMREPVDGQSYFKGRLAGVEPGGNRELVVVVETETGVHRIPFPIITRANLEVEF